MDRLVNLSAVAESNSVHPLVKKLARRLVNKEYITVGSWLKELAFDDVNQLELDILDDDDRSVETAVLLTLILSLAESVYLDTDKAIGDSVGLLRFFVITTKLDRTGELRAHFENMTFDPEMLSNKFASKLDE